MSHATAGQGRRKGRSALSKLVVAVLAAVAFAAALRMGSGGRGRREASQLRSSIAAAAAAGSAPTAAAASPAWAVENTASDEADGTALPEPLDMPGAPAAMGRDTEQSVSAHTTAPAGAEGLQTPTGGTQQPAASADLVEQQQQQQQQQQAEEQQDVAKQLAAPPPLPHQAATAPQPPPQQQSAGQTAARTTARDAGAALGIAKVALLFLTRGPMPLEPVWQEWLRGAEGLLPTFQLAAPGRCSQENVDAVRALAGSSSNDSATATGAALYRRQHLFSIYVHSPPEHPAYSEDSMFHGRETSQRIATEWASHSLVAAVRLLLRDALADPLNKRFILMSESDVPLWPAGLFYLQLLAEPASRVHACGPGGAGWTDLHMADLLHLPREQWYKSSQWFALNRRHAELFVNDTRLDPVFARDCYSEMDLTTWVMKPGGRWCVSDEHYLPVLLATSGEAPALACSAVAGGKGSPTFTLWGQGGAHPRTFIAREMSLAILRYVRNCSALAGEAALDRFPALLARPEQWSVAACQAAAAASAAAAQELTVAQQAAEAAAAARAAEAAALVAASGGAAPPPAARGNVLPAAQAAAAVADQVVAGAVPLLPPYQCNLVLRKMAHDSADELAQKLREGLLLSRAQAAAAAAAANATAAR